MRRIFKFPLPIAPDDETGEVTMPAGAQVVHFEAYPYGSQGSAQPKPTVWALVDDDEEPEVRRFRIYGTGHPLPRHSRHVGTYGDGPFVWHVFELLGEPLPDGLDLPADAEAAYRTLTSAGFVSVDRSTSPGLDTTGKAWQAPDDEPLTTELIMAVATLQEYGFGPVVSK